ncbi:nuclear transport factor 2 family protein [Ktedonospora formicarum]|uniref:SnoaL-like domain-containing protein n=1 Tax=Ktedonospora formicarum TaxID=2778364 RepID=A0A8J3HRA4_9CHLR|nr:nuclear transport factor 2 family protein [Ktedonospora formicarum]GHO42164.1 hypothetical protein KSX_03270 [Ktedonospora formicarum]
MDQFLAEQLIRTYVEGWKEYDLTKILSTLDPDCVLIESQGQTFRGAHKIIREVEKRIASEYGPWKIHRWDITTLTVTGSLCFLEWIFESQRRFEGASIVQYKEGKISSVREYRTTQPLWEASEE